MTVDKLLVPPLPSTSISTDASQEGWGATWGDQVISGSWPTGGSSHINYLELKAIFLALWHWFHSLRGQVISVHADNQTAVAYILQEEGTHSPKLMALTRDLLNFVDKWGMVLRPCYIQGNSNIEADALSQQKTIVEWSLLPDIVGQLLQV